MKAPRTIRILVGLLVALLLYCSGYVVARVSSWLVYEPPSLAMPAALPGEPRACVSKPGRVVVNDQIRTYWVYLIADGFAPLCWLEERLREEEHPSAAA